MPHRLASVTLCIYKFGAYNIANSYLILAAMDTLIFVLLLQHLHRWVLNTESYLCNYYTSGFKTRLYALLVSRENE